MTYTATTPEGIIEEWVNKSQIVEKPFRLAFRTPSSDWKAYTTRGRPSREVLESLAKDFSLHRPQTLWRVTKGLLIVSLWEDGECIYRRER